ncbi:MAG: hypothetical protein SNH88_03590 [Rikenellaceae bacterium]
MLIPSSLIEGEHTILYEFAKLGIYPQESEKVVVVSQDGISAAMLVPSSINIECKQLTSPLLSPPLEAGMHLIADQHKDLLVVKLFNGTSLLYADTIRCLNEADLIYWCSRITKQNEDVTIMLKGDSCSQVKIMRRYFKNVTLCE